jgi:hypothetical protein
MPFQSILFEQPADYTVAAAIAEKYGLTAKRLKERIAA